MKPYIIIGAGPAGLMAAQTLAEQGKQVIVFEQKPAAARKFLVAGHGGFNITHSMPYENMLAEYEPNNIIPYLQHFTNIDTIDWLQKIGIATYKGSSGKIFPQKGIKPIEVLQAWLNYLQQLGVQINYQHTMDDFEQDSVTISFKENTKQYSFNKLILALGGASWPQTGATGKWVAILEQKGITISSLLPSNTGLETTDNYEELAGQSVKNIEVFHNNSSKKGEFIFTNYGIEGSPIYYLNRSVRKATLPTTIYVNLKPQYDQETLLTLWKNDNNSSSSAKLKRALKLSPTAIAILKKLPKDLFTNEDKLLQYIQHYPIEIKGFRPIEEGISTAGGICWSAMNEDLSLKKYPKVHCIGEMLDWDTPTGGYLLQACFSMGNYLGKAIIKGN